MSLRVAAALIYDDDRLLVCQRKENGPYPLKWEFPGGKVESGENNFDALQRELREELGIEVQSAREVFRHCHIYLDQIVDLVFFKVETYRGSISNNVFERLQWLTADELKELDFLEGDLPLIEKLVAGELCLKTLVPH